MGFPFRIGLKDRAVLSLLNGRYWRAVGLVSLSALATVVAVTSAGLAVLASLRRLPYLLPAIPAILVGSAPPPTAWIPFFDPAIRAIPPPGGMAVLLAVQMTGAIATSVLLLVGILMVVSPLSAGAADWFHRNRMGLRPSTGSLLRFFHRREYRRVLALELLRWKELLPWMLLPAGAVLMAMALVSLQYATDAPWFRADLGLAGDSFAGLALPALAAFSLASTAFLPLWIRSYAYRCLPWIAASMPDLSATEAVLLSRRMTRGHRIDLFLLDLSFLGWVLTSLATCGVGLLFLLPYYKAVQAETFGRLVEEALRQGCLRAEVLPIGLNGSRP